MSGSIGWGWLPQDNDIALGTENLPVDRRSEKTLYKAWAPPSTAAQGERLRLFVTAHLPIWTETPCDFAMHNVQVGESWLTIWPGIWQLR